jgi:hypothetical protein
MKIPKLTPEQTQQLSDAVDNTLSGMLAEMKEGRPGATEEEYTKVLTIADPTMQQIMTDENITNPFEAALMVSLNKCPDPEAYFRLLLVSAINYKE